MTYIKEFDNILDNFRDWRQQVICKTISVIKDEYGREVKQVVNTKNFYATFFAISENSRECNDIEKKGEPIYSLRTNETLTFEDIIYVDNKKYKIVKKKEIHYLSKMNRYFLRYVND